MRVDESKLKAGQGRSALEVMLGGRCGRRGQAAASPGHATVKVTS
jgi:hypothetical protein